MYYSKNEKHIYKILAKIKARTNMGDLRENGNMKGKVKRGWVRGWTELSSITMAQYRAPVKPKLNFGYHKT